MFAAKKTLSIKGSNDVKVNIELGDSSLAGKEVVVELFESLDKTELTSPLSVLIALSKAVLTANTETLSHDLQRAILGDVIDTIDRRTPTGFMYEVESEDEDTASFFKSVYQQALEKTGRSPARPYLLSGDLSMMFQFGGQASDYLGELRRATESYPALSDLIKAAATSLTEELHSDEARSLSYLYTHGLDVLHWIDQVDDVPTEDYLLSAPVSYPLIGLTQLINYASVALVANLSPAEMVECAKGVTGHSQGVVSALVASGAKSWEDFHSLTKDVMKLLFWQGARSQMVFDHMMGGHAYSASSPEEEAATPMLSVLKMPLPILEKFVAAANAPLPATHKIDIALINGPSAVVLAGHPKSLVTLQQILNKKGARPEDDQSRVPFSQRKPEFEARYLPMSCPFHAPTYLSSLPDTILEDLKRTGVAARLGAIPKTLQCPVFSTLDGSDLRDFASKPASDFLLHLINLQSIEPVKWPEAIGPCLKAKDVGYIVDFGPSTGTAKLSDALVRGTGLHTICAAHATRSAIPSDMSGREALFALDSHLIPQGVNWEKKFGPKLVRCADGNLMVDTAFSRLTGKPPLMVAGMTPTTVSDSFVAAVTNAGYVAELAGGGLSREPLFRDAISRLTNQLEEGNGISLNLLFLNAKLWNMQFPLIEVLRTEGKPIDSVTIAAGVPTRDTAKDIITQLRECGVKFVAFKPGSVDAIRSVIQIAKDSPDTTIVVQWTGGRAGGHHSFEDVHLPILKTYPALRQVPNVVLVCGSGFGDAKESLPYLNGSWSKPFGFPPMPFDGILLASRVMVSKEAPTADEVKEILVQTEGVKDQSHWDKTYDGEAGGIITVQSELGEPIHKVATRGIMFWKQLDEMIFSLPLKKRAQAVAENRDWIIEHLNSDFQKVYFGKNSQGQVVDLSEMTYAEVVSRMTEIMFLPPDESKQLKGRWIHPTYKSRVVTFLQRLEGRFISAKADEPSFHTLISSLVDQFEDEPSEVLDMVFAKYPRSQEQLLSSEDIDYFLHLLKTGGKPVNFVPVVDGDLEFWFKKDSLWFSEELRAVPDRDAGRTCILQGPVAVKHSKIANEPVAEILNSINKGYIDSLLTKYESEEVIPYVDYLTDSKTTVVTEEELGISSVLTKDVKEDGTTFVAHHFDAAEDIPSTSKWLDFLAGTAPSWLRAALTSKSLVQSKARVVNPLRATFAPKVGQTTKWVVEKGHSVPTCVEIFPDEWTHERAAVSLRIDAASKPKNIALDIAHDIGNGRVATLELKYVYRPDQGDVPFHEVMEDKNDRVKQFYGQIWFDPSFTEKLSKLSVDEKLKSEVTLTKKDIKRFALATSNTNTRYTRGIDGMVQCPMDFAIVAAWEPLISSIFPKAIDGDILKLVHLSNAFDLDNAECEPREGDRILTEMEIVSIRSSVKQQNLTVACTGKMYRLKEDGEGREGWMTITSSFFFRGFPSSGYDGNFVKSTIKRKVTLADASAVGILLAKPWFTLKEGEDDLVEAGETLVFDVQSQVQFSSEELMHKLTNTGTVYNGGIVVGTVKLELTDVLGDPVLAYLNRYGQLVEVPSFFEDGGYQMLTAPDVTQSPATNHDYAIASRDLNPIHTNRFIADLVELPSTITHGMWSSANARRVLERYVAGWKQNRIRSYHANFQGMVSPGDHLATEVKHVGMKSGRQIVDIQTVNHLGSTVLRASAEVEQPLTTFFFTGQGSAEAGMGMDLYNSSAVAKRVWDRADAYFLQTYGFSILKIVRENPKHLTVHFGGTKGQKARANFLKLRREVTVDGVKQYVPLIPAIGDKSASYTFRHPKGLLFATQFTQPALTLVEKAAFEDMVAKELVSPDVMFAGHSLGEYAALSAVGNLLPIESLVDIVFLRGLTMQQAVTRDKLGRSCYGMVAANPGRVNPRFDHDSLTAIVTAIEKHSDDVLQVVNYNVRDRQYVVAGENTNLEALSHALTALATAPSKQANLDEVAKESLKFARNRKAATKDGYLMLQRGTATIPLPGIDVPFHSRFLAGGVPAFRETLQKKIVPENVDLDKLVGKYIPNVTAAPFSVSRDYVEIVLKETDSAILRDVLADWDTASASLEHLGTKLLIELLAYQFASPVRWIETQDLILNRGTARLIEIGPAATLSTMCKQTLAGYRTPTMLKPSNIFWYGNDHDDIYYTLSDQGPSARDAIEKIEIKTDSTDNQSGTMVHATPTPTPTPAPTPAAPALAPTPAATPAPAAGGSPVEIPLAPLEVIKIISSLKLKKPLDEIKNDSTLKTLVGGKSAVQNEILGDLSAEFGNGPENAAEMPLTQLATSMAAGYSTLGKHSLTLVAKLVSAKMPGGFSMSNVKSFLASERMLSGTSADLVLLHGTTMEPSARLSSEGEAKAWLNKVVDSCASRAGVTVPLASAVASAPAQQMSMPAAAAAPQPVPDAPISAEEVIKVLVALKLKKSLAELDVSKSIKELVGGKSAVQNELVGELAKEFGGGPDNSGEIPISELAKAMGGSYSAMGKHSQSLVAKMVSSKMPAGWSLSQIKSKLSLFGPGRQDGLLVHALTMEPAARLASEGEAQTWLDSVTASYCAAANVSMPTAGGSAGGPVGGPVMQVAMDVTKGPVADFVAAQLAAASAFLGHDLREGERNQEKEAQARSEVEKELDVWVAEHGQDYGDGVRPVFDSKKMREYSSAWNWARQDAILLYYDIFCGRLEMFDPQVCARRWRILNRANPDLIEMADYLADEAEKNDHPKLSKAVRNLAQDLRESLSADPLWSFKYAPTEPSVKVTDSGKIEYEEVKRDGIKTIADYVEEMRAGCVFEVMPDAKEDVKEERVVPRKKKVRRRKGISLRKRSVAEAKQGDKTTSPSAVNLPYLYLRNTKSVEPTNDRPYEPTLTAEYLNVLKDMGANGVSFVDKVALVTGCGRGSIGVEIVKGLLEGGATVIATTSSYSKRTTDFYQQIYQSSAGKGARLLVLPFNAGSVQDVNSLVKYIYNDLALDIDFIVPFAAIPENGRDITRIDGRSELSHRAMLTNVIRMLGAVKTSKEERGIETRPAHVLLPLSPNHGVFGNDGLYAESKIALEALLNKWQSESWQDYLSLVGAVIGWTRGTGLMNANNLVARGFEDMGARTFSASEMSFNLIGLLHPDLVAMAQAEPVLAELTGGFAFIKDLKNVTDSLREGLMDDASRRKAIKTDDMEDQKTISGKGQDEQKPAPNLANMDLKTFPCLPTKERLEGLKHLQGMLNHEQTVVITGFGEVGPWGNSRTRWQIEAEGEFSIEGCIELAWIMGFIRYHHGALPSGRQYTGWVDGKDNSPVPDVEVKKRYEEQIMKHTGIRMVEPELFEGYDPKKKMFLHQIAIDKDMPPIELTSKEEADGFVKEHGENVDVYERDGAWIVQVKKGAVIYVPKALQFSRFVAGQVPTGWDPARFGLSKDIIDQVDPVTLFTLVSTVEALTTAGVTDPYEFYEYVHVSEVGNMLGGGMGGMRAIRRTYRDRLLEKPVQGDILQEMFINVMPAWVNMLLLSSSGPIKTPVGACATAAESVEIGYETIKSGKAKICIVGGYDDFGEEGSYEFANMQATSNSKVETEKGRMPSEMSRPTTNTRAGFMESQGAGTQILMSADLALQMGVPIYGIVALTNTASDKEGRSVPAPGQGILTSARETQSSMPSPLLDIWYRKRQMQRETKNIESWKALEVESLKSQSESISMSEGEEKGKAYYTHRMEFIEKEERRMMNNAMSLWGNDFFKGDPTIAPLRGALAVFGLGADDIAVASFHGTGTKANDFNESDVTQQQLVHLGRKKGNVIHTIFQKYLTGHPKGAAAAWMLNGLLQSMNSGIIPGNRNADNVDDKLSQFTSLLYSNTSIEIGQYNAGILKSFGFGQAGAEVLIVHPDFLLASVAEEDFAKYIALRSKREAAHYRYMQEVLTSKRTFVKVKDSAPYHADDQSDVYLDPKARAKFDPSVNSWRFQSKRKRKVTQAKSAEVPEERKMDEGSNPQSSTPHISASTKLEVAMRESAEGIVTGKGQGIGVDVEPLSTIRLEDPSFVENFLERNFTPKEMDYCRAGPDPQSKFAGRWAAKEAVIKAISNCAPGSQDLWKGSAAPVKEIEILPSSSGSPVVNLYGHAANVATAVGVTEVKVSITHSGEYAVAQALAV